MNAMETVGHYANIAIKFMFFTFSFRIMLLSVIATLVLSLINRFIGMTKMDRAGTNIFGFPTGVAEDQSLVEYIFEIIVKMAIYLAVYCACLFAWAYYFMNYAAQ